MDVSKIMGYSAGSALYIVASPIVGIARLIAFAIEYFKLDYAKNLMSLSENKTLLNKTINEINQMQLTCKEQIKRAVLEIFVPVVAPALYTYQDLFIYKDPQQIQAEKSNRQKAKDLGGQVIDGVLDFGGAVVDGAKALWNKEGVNKAAQHVAAPIITNSLKDFIPGNAKEYPFSKNFLGNHEVLDYYALESALDHVSRHPEALHS